MTDIKPATKPFDRVPKVGDRVLGEFTHRYSVPKFVDPEGWDVVSAIQVGRCRSVDDEPNEKGLIFCYFICDDYKNESWSDVKIWDINIGAFTSNMQPMELITDEL